MAREAQFSLMRANCKVVPLDKGELQFHPLCLAFPALPDDEQAALEADIKANGVRDAGWLYEGMILEGRHRTLAARKTGRAMLYREFVGKDPITFVVSANMRRRHMTVAQRAMVLVKLEEYGHGGKRRGIGSKMLSRSELAELGHLSRGSLMRAAAVRDQGVKELQDAAALGQVSIHHAATIAREVPMEQQAEIVARGEKQIVAAAKDIRARRQKERKDAKVERHIAAAKGARPLHFDRKFVIVSADPPWRYERPLVGFSDRSIETHYPTMAFADIEAMQVHKYVADAAAIFLHIPQPLAICETPEGLCYPNQIGRAWGDPNWRDPLLRDPGKWFVPRAQAIWEKRSPEDIVKGGGPLGMGHYWRTDHECIVIMTRGGLALPDHKPRSVYHIRSRGELEHSEKPAQIYADIVAMYPRYAAEGLLLALFERQTRPGFEVWGNEAPNAGNNLWARGVMDDESHPRKTGEAAA
jgi:N6-adenosine-specific RNA methylase IME4